MIHLERERERERGHMHQMKSLFQLIKLEVLWAGNGRLYSTLGSYLDTKINVSFKKMHGFHYEFQAILSANLC